MEITAKKSLIKAIRIVAKDANSPNVYITEIINDAKNDRGVIESLLKNINENYSSKENFTLYLSLEPYNVNTINCYTYENRYSFAINIDFFSAANVPEKTVKVYFDLEDPGKACYFSHGNMQENIKKFFEKRVYSIADCLNLIIIFCRIKIACKENFYKCTVIDKIKEKIHDEIPKIKEYLLCQRSQTKK